MIRRIALALTLAAILLLAGCGGDGAANTPSSTATTTPSESAFAGTEIVVALTNGKVVPATHRVKVAEGTQVRLLVTSDKADEVHVHGFDILKDVSAGQQATLDFTADQTGVFEVEGEQSGLQLLQLEVR